MVVHPLIQTGLLIVGIVVGLFLADRVLLWMEWRGWINYRTTAPNMRGTGNAFLELTTMVDPSKRHVLEVRQLEDMELAEDEDDGGPDVPGRRRIPPS